MLVAVDIGNTSTTIGFFEGEKLTSLFTCKSKSEKTKEEISDNFSSFLNDHRIDRKSIEGCIISSVVPSLNNLWMDLLKDFFDKDPLFVSSDLDCGVEYKVDYPKEIGADIICDLVAAKKKYGNSVIIIDLGTASKYIVLDKDGAFAGAIFAPGLKLSLSALIDKSACLPEIHVELPKTLIGKNTFDCMNSGIMYGTVASIKGLVEMIEEELGYKMHVVLTGGYAMKYFKFLLPSYHYEETLLFDGEIELYKRNKK